MGERRELLQRSGEYSPVWSFVASVCKKQWDTAVGIGAYNLGLLMLSPRLSQTKDNLELSIRIWDPDLFTESKA